MVKFEEWCDETRCTKYEIGWISRFFLTRECYGVSALSADKQQTRALAFTRSVRGRHCRSDRFIYPLSEIRLTRFDILSAIILGTPDLWYISCTWARLVKELALWFWLNWSPSFQWLKLKWFGHILIYTKTSLLASFRVTLYPALIYMCFLVRRALLGELL